MVDALHADYSVRHICDTLGFNRRSLYYHAKSDVFKFNPKLRDEIRKPTLRYPKYGYGRTTQLLLRMGYAVGYRRAARLMKADNLLVAINHDCQTTQSLRGCGQWRNRLENHDICQCNQVWVGDITYVRLKEQLVYVSVLMDVFTQW